jgi:Ca-activated chloride channel family protein
LLQRFLYIVICSFVQTLVFGQQFYFKGEVKDEAGKLLQNVTILHHPSGYLYYSGQSGAYGLMLQAGDTISFFLDGFYKLPVVAKSQAYNIVTLKRKPKATGSPYKLSSLTENLRRESQQQWFTGDETYASIVENQFVNTATYPSTGITLNIDRAAYSNIRRFINMQTVVPPDAVRIEEMLNYFNLNYAEPANKKTFEISPVLTTCPWNPNNQLLFASIRSKKLALDSLPPTHLVFLIDVSGSMDMPNRLPLLKSAFRGLVNNLRAKDSVSIVVYGGTVGTLLNTTSGAQKKQIFDIIDSLQPGGSTPGESGIKLAYSVARNHFIPRGNNRVILATDGDFNVGLRSESDLETLIQEQSKAGIYLTCLGVGMGNYKDSKIQVLAQKGNGNFAYLDSYAEAEKVLMKEFMQTLYTVADDAYLNIQFNPAYVKDYRVIGFDNKVGAIKDTLAVIEGGTIGSAYSVLVAFEIVPVNNELTKTTSIQPVTFSLKYKLPASSKELEETLKPSLQLTELSKLGKCHQLATALIMFGTLLRESRVVKTINWNDLTTLATLVADIQVPSEREFLNLIQQAKVIYSKRKKSKSLPQ